MDESNNGPVPGIIGQDTPSEATASAPVEQKDSGKVFDNSAFTGQVDEPQSLSFKDGQLVNNKEKKPLIFTRWQFWAILSGVITAAFVATVLIMSASFNGRIANSESAARYDSLSNTLDNYKKEFDEKLKDYSKVVYAQQASSYNLTITPLSDYDAKSDESLYPSESEIAAAGNECLKQDMYGLTDDDIAYISSRKNSTDLMSEGKNIADEAERLEKINNAYRSASTSIDSCHDPLINIRLKDFELELGEPNYVEKEDSFDVRRGIKVKYNGEKELKSVTLIYGLLDKNGLVKEYLKMEYKGTEKPIQKGDTFETRLCGANFYGTTDNCVYTQDTRYQTSMGLDAYKALKPKLLSIYGKYPSNYDYKTTQ